MTGWARLTTLDGWSALGQSVGGFATATGLFFVAYQIATWKALKVREVKSGFAHELARKVNDVCNALEEAVRDPRSNIPPEVLSGNTSPWVGLDSMRHQFRVRMTAAVRPLAELHQALMVAGLHFTVDELQDCVFVFTLDAAMWQHVEAAFSGAEGLLPDHAAFDRFAGVLKAYDSLVEKRRNDALRSLRNVAGFDVPPGRVRRWIRNLRATSAKHWGRTSFEEWERDAEGERGRPGSPAAARAPAVEDLRR